MAEEQIFSDKIRMEARMLAAKWTLIYLIIFYPAFRIAFSFAITYAPRFSIAAFAWGFILTPFLIPLSMFVSILLMWISYFRKKYDSLNFAKTLPLFPWILLFVLSWFL